MQNPDTAPFGHLDLRVLGFLAAALELRSVTLAGERVGLSQPASSRLLAQARRAFGDDPLLIRRGSEYVPTARGVELLPQLHSFLAHAERLFAKPNLPLATTQRTIRIATTDYGSAVVLSPLMGRLAAVAPGLSLEGKTWNDDTLSDMALGLVDLGLFMSVPLPSGFRSRVLFQEHYACILRRGHPVLACKDREGHIKPQQLASLPRVIAMHPEPLPTMSNDPLSEFGEPNTKATFRTPYFLAGPFFVSKSDYQLCSTRRLADLIATMLPLEVVDVPEAGTFQYCVFWHDRSGSDIVVKAVINQIAGLYS